MNNSLNNSAPPAGSGSGGTSSSHRALAYLAVHYLQADGKPLDKRKDSAVRLAPLGLPLMRKIACKSKETGKCRNPLVNSTAAAPLWLECSAHQANGCCCMTWHGVLGLQII